MQYHGPTITDAWPAVSALQPKRESMAGRQNNSFLKRQKEQKRLEKASAKRAARQQRRDEKAAGRREEPSVDSPDPEIDVVPE